MPPPPPAVRRRRQGTRGPPPLHPPPLPLRPKSGRRQTEETAVRTPPKRPLHPGCGGTTAEAGAHTPCLLPADGGPAAPGTAQTERPYQRPARGRRGREPGRGGFPPLPPPPSRTDPSAADRAAPDARGRLATPTARVYPGGARRGQRKGGQRPTGRGGRGAAPPTPPPLRSPPSLGATGAALRPPGAEGTPPPPRMDRDAGGGDAAGPAPAGVAAAGRAHTSVPEQRAHQNSKGAAPHMTLP